MDVTATSNKPNTMKEEVKLGQLVKDRITGFEGIVIAITNWLYGCNRITIQPRELKDGKPVEAQSFDVQQLEIIDDKPMSMKTSKMATTKPGGPRPEPTRR